MENPKQIYRDLVDKGMHPVDAAKEAQARTGLSVVTGRPINRSPKFSRKTGKSVIGQFGVTGKSNSAFGQYGN